MHFSETKLQMCITSFFVRITKERLCLQQIYDIEHIFISPSESAASHHCKKIAEQWQEKKYVTGIVIRSLNLISHIYRYSNEKRMIVGSTNIINYIAEIVQILIYDRQYNNKNIAKNEIEIVSRVVLKNCHKIIPLWDQLEIPI